MMWLARRTREERGISTVIVAVSLVGILGAAVLAIDAGGLYATRRRLVTATDAGVLAAARRYAVGPDDPSHLDPCSDKAAGENEALVVLQANEPDAEHNETVTPDGYHVTTAPRDCKTGTVRFDAKLKAGKSFSGIFGFGTISPFASSTAEFGWVVAMSGGLRPLAICDQASQSYPNMQTPPGQGPPYAHFALWNGLHNNVISPDDYNRYFGSPTTTPLTDGYPSASLLNVASPNSGRLYLPPAQGGGVVHRVDMRDTCAPPGVRPPPWRGWVDLGGATADNDLAHWLRQGFDRTVSLGDLGSSPPIPKNCNATGVPYCWADTTSRTWSSDIRDPLNSLLCPALTPSKDCLKFPILVDHQVIRCGSHSCVHQTAFIFVILRGWGVGSENPVDLLNNACDGTHGCVMDLEFVDALGVGTIGHNPGADGSITTPRGISLCGVDHDSKANRCHV